MSDSPAKYHRELLRRLPKGYSIGYPRVQYDERTSRTRGSHPVLIGPGGELVRGPDGRPVTVCNTPSRATSLKNDLKAIKRAGVPVQ